MLGLAFSSKLDWGSYIISIAKTASKKIGALIRSMKFIYPNVALYLCKSTIWLWMDYCCHIWAAAPSCYLELLGKPQKHMQDCWSLFCYLSWTLDSLLKCSQLKSFRKSFTLVDVHLNWLNWLYFFFPKGDLLIILVDCMIFLSTSLDVTRMSMSTVSFLAQLDSGIICVQNDLLCHVI